MTEERESPEGDAIFGALNAFSQTKGSDCEVICKNTNMKLPWGFPTREILPSRSLWNHGVSFTKCFLKQSIPFAFVAVLATWHIRSRKDGLGLPDHYNPWARNSIEGQGK